MKTGALPGFLNNPQWSAVRRGLQLANNPLGVVAFSLYYGLWCIIGVVLAAVFIVFIFLDKARAFERALDPVALYAFLCPLALILAVTWAAGFVGRVLWCRIPDLLSGTFLAVMSVAGRIAILVVILFLLRSDQPFKEAVLLPPAMLCAAFAIVGLLSDWGFIWLLSRKFAVETATEIADSQAEPEAQAAVEKPVKSIFKRDVNELLEKRFPRVNNALRLIIFPALLILMSWMKDGGHPAALLSALGRFALLIPIILQIFWMPRELTRSVLDAMTLPAESDRSESPSRA